MDDRDIRREASRVQNATLKLKAVPFVPPFQKVERGVWTDNSARTVKDSQCLSQHSLMHCSHRSRPHSPTQMKKKNIIIRTLSIKNVHPQPQKLNKIHVWGVECAKIFHKAIISCTSPFMSRVNSNWSKHGNVCALKLLLCLRLSSFDPWTLASNMWRCELELNDATLSWFRLIPDVATSSRHKFRVSPQSYDWLGDGPPTPASRT